MLGKPSVANELWYHVFDKKFSDTVEGTGKNVTYANCTGTHENRLPVQIKWKGPHDTSFCVCGP